MLTTGYFFALHGFHPRGWRISAQRFVGLNVIGPVVVQNPTKRRDDFAWPAGKGRYQEKVRAVAEWVWVWLK